MSYLAPPCMCVCVCLHSAPCVRALSFRGRRRIEFADFVRKCARGGSKAVLVAALDRSLFSACSAVVVVLVKE